MAFITIFIVGIIVLGVILAVGVGGIVLIVKSIPLLKSGKIIGWLMLTSGIVLEIPIVAFTLAVIKGIITNYIV